MRALLFARSYMTGRSVLLRNVKLHLLRVTFLIQDPVGGAQTPTPPRPHTSFVIHVSRGTGYIENHTRLQAESYTCANCSVCVIHNVASAIHHRPGPSCSINEQLVHTDRLIMRQFPLRAFPKAELNARRPLRMLYAYLRLPETVPTTLSGYPHVKCLHVALPRSTSRG